MRITKRYTDWLANMKKAAEVVSFLQSQEGADESSSLMLLNGTTMARTAGDGLLHLMRRCEKELAGDNVKPEIQGDLFPATPADRAVVEADLRDVVETFFAEHVQRDDTGRGPKGEDVADFAAAAVRDRLLAFDDDPARAWPTVEQIGTLKMAERVEVEEWARRCADGDSFEMPEALRILMGDDAPPRGDLASDIKAAIFAAEEPIDGNGLLQGDMPPAVCGANPAEIERVLWALIHTGEILVQGGSYTASDATLSLDVMAMLEAQPDIGTEDGLPEDDIRLMPMPKAEDVASAGAGEGVPESVDLVCQVVYREGPLTRLEVIDKLKGVVDEVSVGTAIDWLVEHGRIDQDDELHGALGFAEDLDQMEGAQLAALYEQVVGRKPGNRKPDTLRAEIAETRDQQADAAADAPPADEQDQ